MNFIIIVYGPIITIDKLFKNGDIDFDSIDFIYVFYNYKIID